MIINSSRASLFQECRQKMYNWDIRRLLSHREADPLMIGLAFHAGVAHWYATGKVEESSQVAETTFRSALVGQTILPEENALIEQNIRFSRVALEKYAKHWKDEPFTVLMPEVSFRIPLPNTTHHCYFVHKILHPPSTDEVANDASSVIKCEDQRCLQPHFYTGRTDAVISWRNMIWLLEHKTSAQTGSTFFDRFLLDNQTTGYLYGIWKQTGTRPHGFILNVVKKPYAKSADPFNIGFEREPYVKDEASLAEFEKEISLIATDYEHAVEHNVIYKNTSSCTKYNRRCYYFDLCQRHGEVQEDEFRTRNSDYVNQAYHTLLGLEAPKEDKDALTFDLPDAS